jgi:hypothetical protein
MTRSDAIKDLIVRASVRHILESLDSLTDVEFRRWRDFCEGYEDTHPSHFKGTEAHFILTGRWELSGEIENERSK